MNEKETFTNRILVFFIIEIFIIVNSFILYILNYFEISILLQIISIILLLSLCLYITPKYVRYLKYLAKLVVEDIEEDDLTKKEKWVIGIGVLTSTIIMFMFLGEVIIVIIIILFFIFSIGLQKGFEKLIRNKQN